MIKQETDEIVAFKLKSQEFETAAVKALTDYLIRWDLLEEGRIVEAKCFAKGSAFYDEMVRLQKLEEWYDPIYAKIELGMDYLDSLGFKTVKDDGQYGEAIEKRTNGMTIINWNREGAHCTYFGDKLEKNIYVCVKKDGGTRTVFNGYIFNERELSFILDRVR